LGANDAYEEALKLDPNNAQAKSGLQSVQRAMESEGGAGGPMGGLGNMFNDPQLIQKLAANPKTSGLLGDQQFMAKLMQIKQNPQNMGAALQDPRMLQVMSVLLGIDMSFGDPSNMPGGAAGAAGKEGEEDVDMPDLRPSSPPQAKSAREPERVPEPEPEPELEDEEVVAKREAKAKADEEKKLGTENYKKRNFDDAISHYSKAWDLYKDITYLTNLSAAYFEKGDYDQCIEACKNAITEGREVYADFKLIAKAYGRMGSAYEKKGDWANAIDNYQRSLTEHRTPDILSKLRAAEKAKIKAEKESYLNPEEAEKARELGNEKFKAADWPAAVEAYSEMIKRAPEDPRGYSNRAACFIKLLAYPSAVQDCDQAIKHDVKFIRAYLRKAQALFAMREYNKCLDVCEEALERDEGGKNTREIQQQQEKAIQAQFSAREGESEEAAMKRIQNDPEVSRIEISTTRDNESLVLEVQRLTTVDLSF
jgi:stress-induced-phosphoprotein 1